jgi:hypothetical protein
MRLPEQAGRAAGTIAHEISSRRVAELRGHERQAAEKLEQWKTHHEERKRLDASPAAITLGMIFSVSHRPTAHRN